MRRKRIRNGERKFYFCLLFAAPEGTYPNGVRDVFRHMVSSVLRICCCGACQFSLVSLTVCDTEGDVDTVKPMITALDFA